MAVYSDLSSNWSYSGYQCGDTVKAGYTGNTKTEKLFPLSFFSLSWFQQLSPTLKGAVLQHNMLVYLLEEKSNCCDNT